MSHVLSAMEIPFVRTSIFMVSFFLAGEERSLSQSCPFGGTNTAGKLSSAGFWAGTVQTPCFLLHGGHSLAPVPQLRKWAILASPTQCQVARNNRTRLTPFSLPTSQRQRTLEQRLPFWHWMLCSSAQHVRRLEQPLDDVTVMSPMTVKR